MTLQKEGSPTYMKSKSQTTVQTVLQEVCQEKSWTETAHYLSMTSVVTAITQVCSKASGTSLRGLFYVLPALHETTSWKCQSSNTESIERLRESPLSLTLCWEAQDLQTWVLFCACNAALSLPLQQHWDLRVCTVWPVEKAETQSMNGGML